MSDDYDPEDNARKCYDVAISAMREKLLASRREFLSGRVHLYAGDCREMLAMLPDKSVDSCVCDPPYHLTSIVKRFGGENASPAKVGKTGAYARASAGFMGKQWDGGDVAFQVETWAAVYRVLKPGAHLVAFSGTRTYHRMACAIEDAGFEIRDQLAWCYGSGFPKSHDVSKAIDRAAGAEREVTKGGNTKAREFSGKFDGACSSTRERRDMPATEEAEQWEGWGTALKPAWEPIVLARKPLIGTVAENVLQHGTGALNIDGCRVEGGAKKWESPRGGICLPDAAARAALVDNPLGRWPANLVHDGSEEVLAAFPIAGGQKGGGSGGEPSSLVDNVYGDRKRVPFGILRDDDWGSAARFFYTAKADSDDRLGSKHPTVKPLDLMQWLVRLVTPRGGVVLDPFAGTGTTGEAAWREGMRAILIEREAEYITDIERRMELAAKPTKRAAVAKTKNNLDDPNELPLFKMDAAE